MSIKTKTFYAVTHVDETTPVFITANEDEAIDFCETNVGTIYESYTAFKDKDDDGYVPTPIHPKSDSYNFVKNSEDFEILINPATAYFTKDGVPMMLTLEKLSRPDLIKIYRKLAYHGVPGAQEAVDLFENHPY